MSRALMLILGLAGCRQVFGLEEPTRLDAALVDTPAIDVDAPRTATVQFITVMSSISDIAKYDFDAVPTGMPAADRVLIIVTHGRDAGGAFGAASLKVGGAMATKHVAVNETMGSATTAMFTIVMPMGMQSDMTLEYASGAGDRRAAIGVWAAYGLESSAPLITTQASTNASNPVQAMIGAIEGGFVIAGVSMSAVVAGTTSTWAGVTETYEQNIESSIFTAATLSPVTMDDALTIIHSSTDTTTSHQLVVGSFH